MAGFTEYVRVFTAVLLDAGLRAEIGAEAERLLSGVGRVGRVPEQNLHVTLKFVGEVHRDDLAALDEVVADGGARLAPAEVEVAGLGAFPDLRRPRVLWAGVSDPSGILTPVHARLNETLVRFGAKRERKRYVPHVTFGRVRGRFDLREFARRLDATDEPADELWFGTQDVTEIALVMSEMRRGGPPTYTVLGRYGPQRNGGA